MNEGLDSDFFKKQYPRLQPMSHEEYKNAPKRERGQSQEHWHG
jgi:hypothetical protein